MLQRFAYVDKYEANVNEYKFWQEGNQVKERHSPAFLFEKLKIGGVPLCTPESGAKSNRWRKLSLTYSVQLETMRE